MEKEKKKKVNAQGQQTNGWFLEAEGRKWEDAGEWYRVSVLS